MNQTEGYAATIKAELSRLLLIIHVNEFVALVQVAGMDCPRSLEVKTNTSKETSQLAGLEETGSCTPCTPCSRFSAFVAPSSRLGNDYHSQFPIKRWATSDVMLGSNPEVPHSGSDHSELLHAAPRSRAPRYCPMTLCSLSFSNCWRRCGRTKRSIGCEKQGVSCPTRLTSLPGTDELTDLWRLVVIRKSRAR